MKEKDIISRRKFFKKSASAIIPTIAIAVVPQILTSCEIDEPFGGSSGCSDCSGTCSSTCKGGCKSACGVNCSALCADSCLTSCSARCQETCHRGSK